MRAHQLCVMAFLIYALGACTGQDSGPSETKIRDDFIGVPPTEREEDRDMLKKKLESVKISVKERLTEPNNEMQTITVAITKGNETGTYSVQYKRYKEGWKLVRAFEPDADTRQKETIKSAIANGMLAASNLKVYVTEEYQVNKKWPEVARVRPMDPSLL